MPYYANWTRIEPDPRATDVSADADRPFADPFWALGRQWWVGEWAGFDGGTPQFAEIDMHHDPVIGKDGAVPSLAERALASPPKPSAPGRWRRALRLSRDAIDRVDAQLSQWRALLDKDPAAFNGNLSEMIAAVAKALDDLPGQFPLALPDTVGTRIHMRYRVDGFLLAKALDDGALPQLSGFLQGFAQSHAAEIHAETHTETPAFDIATGRHRSALTAASGQVLSVDRAAAPYLHWSDVRPPDRTTAVSSNRQARTRLNPVRFDGAAPTRLWQQHHGDTDYVAAAAGPADFGQLLAAAVFAEQAGTRWIAAWDVPAPALVSVQAVTVRDTFGRGQPLAAPRDDKLAGWSLASDSNRMLFLNPPQILTGPDIEDLSLQIDPMDNLMWAIEDVELDDFGRGRRTPPGAPQPDVAQESYAARVTPPAHWTAYQRVAEKTMERAILAPATGEIRSRSSLIGDVLEMSPEMLGPLGRRVRTHWCVARDADGKRHVWRVHQARLAPSRGGSGLAHDQTLKPFI